MDTKRHVLFIHSFVYCSGIVSIMQFSSLPDDSVCKICNDTISKYRCPRCKIRYCSVRCYKDHQSTGCVSVQYPSIKDSCIAISPASYCDVDNSEARLLTEEQKRNLLGHEGLKTALKNKRLRTDLDYIDSAHNRRAALQKARLNPEFAEFISDIVSTRKI